MFARRATLPRRARLASLGPAPVLTLGRVKPFRSFARPRARPAQARGAYRLQSDTGKPFDAPAARH